MSHYILSPKAKKDIIGIREYTTKRWGEKQSKHYLSNIRAKMRWLTENKELGKNRDDIKLGYLSYPEGRHNIYYRININEDIEILDVLHESMDPVRHF
ncbi:MAG: type II toxin-antitoxin system RelE/ParE family toxin [Chlorobi bacterium]|nr:type II toxin-antitoxin system RelE/ParE family toxin [Chlorobiota bacterium]